jgi:hypothetical protein
MRRGFAVVLVLLSFQVMAASQIVIGKKRAAVNPSDVVLYLQAPEKYEQIAIVEADSMGSFAVTSQGKIDKAIARMKKRAAKLGANAIILNGTGDRNSTVMMMPAGNGAALGITGGIIKSISGLAIWEDRPSSSEASSQSATD